MSQSTAQIVSQMLEAHYHKSRDGYFGARPSSNALKLMEGGLLQDYLNEAGPQGLVREFDSALTWATPTNCRDRLLILNCAAAADILPDDEPDHLSWRSIKIRDQEPVQRVHLAKQPGMGFGFSLVTIDRSVYVRRLQPFSPACTSGKLQEGDRVISISGKTVGPCLNQNGIIQLLKKEEEIELTLAHVAFDGKGCPETTYDRHSPLQSPALESSYKLALDLSQGSPGTTVSNGSEEKTSSSLYRHNGMSSTGCDSMLRGNVRADIRTDTHTDTRKNTLRHVSVGSVGDSMSTASSHDVALTHSSSGSDPTTRSSLSPRYEPGASPRYEGVLSRYEPGSPAYERRYETPPPGVRGAVDRGDTRSSLTSSISSHSSINKDYYRDSMESIPLSVQSMGSTEYIVLPNHGKGIGIGISGKSGVIIRNILQGSIADKDGRLQIGDHILQVNNIKCQNIGQAETKEVVIPELRNSTPTVRLLVQHASKRLRTPSSNTASSGSANTPAKSGPGSTLPVQKHLDQTPDLLLPEALWSDAHPSTPIAYRFGTVVLPAPAWISWSRDKHFLTLTRLANGFGFSIMDYKEPKEKAGGDVTSVLIIRQITPFGAADLEGHLALGERIMAVNGEPITNHTIEDIVGMIKPCSVLQLKMCKPVESEGWKGLLNTNISAIPLVSGPRSTSRNSSQEAISTSTLNVTRATSYQSLNSETSGDLKNFTHQPIIRHPGDNIRHPGDNIRHPGDNIRHPGDNIRHPGDNIRHPGDNIRHPGDNIRHPGDNIRHPGDNIRHPGDSMRQHPSLTDNCRNAGESLPRYQAAQVNNYGDLSNKEEEVKQSFTYSRGMSSQYEQTEQYYHTRAYSADRSSRLSNHGAGEDPGDQGSGGTLRRRYQPTNHSDLAVIRRSNSDKSDSLRREQYEPQRKWGYSAMYGRAGSENWDTNHRAYEGRQPRPPERECTGSGRVRSPDVRRQRYVRPVAAPETTFRTRDRPETTFGLKHDSKRSHSSGSNSEIQSIISSISGINNSELTELWKQRSVKPTHTQQLSRV